MARTGLRPMLRFVGGAARAFFGLCVGRSRFASPRSAGPFAVASSGRADRMRLCRVPSWTARALEPSRQQRTVVAVGAGQVYVVRRRSNFC